MTAPQLTGPTFQRMRDAWIMDFTRPFRKGSLLKIFDRKGAENEHYDRLPSVPRSLAPLRGCVECTTEDDISLASVHQLDKSRYTINLGV